MAALSRENSGKYFFVSYDHDDRDFVEKFSTDLEKEEFIIWIDSEGLQPGTRNWEDSVRSAIKASSALLLIATPGSRKSLYVQDELAIADMYDRPIIPFWASGEQWIDSIPMGMGKAQYIDVRTREAYEQGLRRIIPTLRTLQVAAKNGDQAATAEIAVLSDDQSVTSDRSTSTHHGVVSSAPSEPNTILTPRNPYKGLRAFREDEQQDFFGRERFLDELVTAVESHKHERILPIIGPSGSGKSSLVIAGLLPRLQHGAISGSANWYYLPTIVPGTHPLEGLALALKSALPDSFTDIQKDLENPNARGLHLRASQIISQHNNPRIVLYIDQFEELFTQLDVDNEAHEAERKQFINLLVAAVSERTGPMTILLSMRADFYDRPMNYPGLGKLIETYGRSVLPMSVAELYEVVQKPALLPDVQLSFEDGLQAELVFEIRDQLGGLPLLQFALDQLFYHRDGQRLTLDAYRRIGGVRGALARHAEDTYESLGSEEYKSLARALFLRLIEPGLSELDTTRRRANVDEFQLSSVQQTTNMQHVIATFVSARLLVADQGTISNTIEVSHEALIREWKRLNGWLDEARDDIQLQQEINADVREWVSRSYPPDRLYRGSQLHDALEWTRRNTPSQKEMEFLNVSQVAEQRFARRQRLRTYTILALVFSVLVVVVGALIFVTQEQEKNLHEIRDTQAQAFPLLANKYASEGEIPEAIDTALKSLEFRPDHFSPDAQSALVNAISRPYQGQASAFAIAERISQITWNSKRTFFLGVQSPALDCADECLFTVRVWDKDGEPVTGDLPSYAGNVTVSWAPANDNWNPDGTHILISSIPSQGTNCTSGSVICEYKTELWNTEGKFVRELLNFSRGAGTLNWDSKDGVALNNRLFVSRLDCLETCVLDARLIDLVHDTTQVYTLELPAGFMTSFKSERSSGISNENPYWVDTGVVFGTQISDRLSYATPLYLVQYLFDQEKTQPTLVYQFNHDLVLPQRTIWSPDKQRVVGQRFADCDEPVCPVETYLWNSRGDVIAGPFSPLETVTTVSWNGKSEWFLMITQMPVEADCTKEACTYIIRNVTGEGEIIGEPQMFEQPIGYYWYRTVEDNVTINARYIAMSRATILPSDDGCGDACMSEILITDNEGNVTVGSLTVDQHLTHLFWNGDGTRFITASNPVGNIDCNEQLCRSTAVIWDIQGNRVAGPLVQDGPLFSIAWNKLGTHLTSISYAPENYPCPQDPCDLRMTIWSSEGDKVVGPLNHTGGVYDSLVIWNTSNTYFAVQNIISKESDQYQVQIWDVRGRQVSEPQTFGGRIGLSWVEGIDQLTAYSASTQDCPIEGCAVQIHIWKLDEQGNFEVNNAAFHELLPRIGRRGYAAGSFLWNSDNTILTFAVYERSVTSGYNTNGVAYMLGLEDNDLRLLHRLVIKNFSQYRAEDYLFLSYQLEDCQISCYNQFELWLTDSPSSAKRIAATANMMTSVPYRADEAFAFALSTDGKLKVWQKESARYRPFEGDNLTEHETIIWGYESVAGKTTLLVNVVEGDPIAIFNSEIYSVPSNIAFNDPVERRYLLTDYNVWDATTGQKLMILGGGYSSTIQWMMGGDFLLNYYNSEVQRVPVNLDTLVETAQTHLAELKEVVPATATPTIMPVMPAASATPDATSTP